MIYGPHEYLLPTGALEPGDYRLTLDHLRYSHPNCTFTWHSTGYIQFTVVPVPVPEPLSALLLFVGIASVLTCHRVARRRLEHGRRKHVSP